MRRVVLSSLCNILMMIYIPIMLIYYKVKELDPAGSLMTTSEQVLMFLPVIVIVIFNVVINVKYRKTAFYAGELEMDSDDEREAMITAGATRLAYRTLLYASLGGLILFVLLDFGHKPITDMLAQSRPDIDPSLVAQAFTFCSAVVLICTAIVLTLIVYCVKWCREYRN
jgi:hypothetical protein